MLRFTKMHGAGNDYVYVDGRDESRDWPTLAEAMSDRHRGVGSDGLIVALRSGSADLRMAMFNADGSEGEMLRKRDTLPRRIRALQGNRTHGHVARGGRDPCRTQDGNRRCGRTAVCPARW